MFSIRNVNMAFALVLVTCEFSYGQWYGPDGIQPMRPLGPGGIQRIQPLGPGGIQRIQPLGPGGTQQKCCFQYGFGSRMTPCCLEVISCERHDQLAMINHSGGSIGKHHRCPTDAAEAHQIVKGNVIFSILFREKWYFYFGKN